MLPQPRRARLAMNTDIRIIELAQRSIGNQLDGFRWSNTEFKAEDNVDAAIRVLDALEHAFGLVGANPEIGFLHQLGASGK